MFLDLLTVKFLLSYSTRPLQIFGLLGLCSAAACGFLVALCLSYQRLVLRLSIANRPLLLLAILLMVIGIQFITLGLLAEIMVRAYHEAVGKGIYFVREIVDCGAQAEPPANSINENPDARPRALFPAAGDSDQRLFPDQALGEARATDRRSSPIPLGQDVALPRLRIRRVPNLFGFRRIKIGPSLAKIPLDSLLTLGRLSRDRRGGGYDLVYSHEEAAAVGIALARAWRSPPLYDMHSSLPQQLRNFEFSRSPLLECRFSGGSSEPSWRALRRSSSSAAIFSTRCRLRAAETRLSCSKISWIFPRTRSRRTSSLPRRGEVAPRGEKIVVYAGNFEAYQGIPLLLRGRPSAAAKAPSSCSSAEPAGRSRR